MRKSVPWFIKYPVILIGIVVVYFILTLGKPLLAPIALAIIITLAVFPVFEFLYRKGLPEVPAIICTILCVFAVLTAIGVVVYFQLLNLIDDSPKYLNQLEMHLFSLQAFIAENLNVNAEEQTEYLTEQANKFVSSIPNIVVSIVNSMLELILYVGLVSILVFFFIYNRDNFKDFLIRTLPMDESRIRKFYVTTNEIIQNYIGGLVLVMLLLAVTNSLALIIIGIDHAIFFGVLAALLTVVPYIGVFIGSSLPVMFALITKDSLLYPLAVMLTFDVIQFLEGNFITPNIMGDKVNLSPLVIIIALFIGGVVWGPIGMVLSVPYLAILKIIIGSSHTLKPFEMVLTGYNYEGEDSLLKRIFNSLIKGMKSIRRSF